MDVRIQVGDFVRHFKRETLSEEEKNIPMYLYRVLAIAKHTETEEELVIYQAQYGEKQIYARPKDMFYSKVDKEKYPDIKQEYRLELTTQLEVALCLVHKCNHVDSLASIVSFLNDIDHEL